MRPLAGPVLVHSDLAEIAFGLRGTGQAFDRGSIPNAVLNLVAKHIDEGIDGLVFPAFNYDYPQSRVFDVERDPVQVGALPEWIRQTGDFERTHVPIYSFLHRGAVVTVNERTTINPFGVGSVFDQILAQKGQILLAGVGINTLTMIHFVEEIFGPPLFRYQKKFEGTVRTSTSSFLCVLNMHVRPANTRISYDWQKIEATLESKKIIRAIDEIPKSKVIHVRNMVELLGDLITQDPLFLLSEKTKSDLFPTGGVPFKRLQIEDFEPVR